MYVNFLKKVVTKIFTITVLVTEKIDLSLIIRYFVVRLIKIRYLCKLYNDRATFNRTCFNGQRFLSHIIIYFSFWEKKTLFIIIYTTSSKQNGSSNYYYLHILIFQILYKYVAYI